MPFDRFMRMALYEPGLGYYVNGLHKFGSAGDFVTAPEQGGLFAAALARQCDEVAEGLASDWTLMELGAGSGVLARDLLVRLASPPGEYLILEPSAALRSVQHETLSELPGPLRERVRWVDQPPDETFDGVIIGNEVLDALPVARFRIGERGELIERGVNWEISRFGWIDRPPRPRVEDAVEDLRQALSTPCPAATAAKSPSTCPA